MGVDNNDFILMRYNNDGYCGRYEYRKIYRLNIVVDDDLIRMELYEIQIPLSERR